MNNLIYLYELDSVRNSPEEVEYAQQALFEELVMNGNIVVLSFNQLTDSKSFVSLIQDNNFYPNIIKLFKNGWIRVSLYCPYRTASQYMQEAISKCLIEDEGTMENTFLFSALPVKTTEKNLLKHMADALKFSDLQLLEVNKDRFTDEDGQLDEAANNNRIQYLTRYLHMILTISQEKLAFNEPKISNNNERRNCFLDYIIEARKILASSPNKTFSEAALEIQKLEQSLCGKNGIQNRSIWHKYLQDSREQKELNFSPDLDKIIEGVIDLCYNFQVENSINGVLKHYLEEEFENEFLLRLKCYLQLEPYHNFLQPESNEWRAIPARKDLKWSTAARIHDKPLGDFRFSRFNIPKAPDIKDYMNEVYEQVLINHRKKWEAQKWKLLIGRFFILGMNALIFFMLNCLIGKIQNDFGSLSNNVWINLLITIFFFGLINSWIMQVLCIPDVLETAKNIRTSIIDFKVMWKTQRGFAYNSDIVKKFLKEQENGARMETVR